jgi:hypothetical protein
VIEVRTLDGDMQNLVYENYSKFILATDTIKKVVTHAIKFIKTWTHFQGWL